MKFSSKHKGREKAFGFSGFKGGLNLDTTATSLSVQELSECKNMKYVANSEGGLTIKTRQGTTVISTAALPAAADVKACTYYIAQAKYILATTAKLYYLDGDLEPVEIGSISGLPTFTEFNEKLIIHDSGVTKAWDGTTFETLNSLYEDVSIGTGDNATVQFTGTLAGAAGAFSIENSSITITFTDTTTKTITDDGAGALIGDVNAGGNNTINVATGAYDFTCSGAPDDTTDITITYERAGGAPKSKAGFVRAGRLYMWGDSDNPSRLWYSGVNDEDAYGESSGGYLDVDKDDGYALSGALNFYDTCLLIKENSLKRLDNFPGDPSFRVEPLIDNLGALAYRTIINDGNLVSFLHKGEWVAMSSTERFGDIQQTTPLSKSFTEDITENAVAASYAEFNKIDNPLWLTMGGDIYVVSLGTGGQLSKYSFAFGHSCYKYINGMMLIGGEDGKLYKLVDDESTYKDNTVSYSDDTYMRTAFTDWDLPLNKKHNKKIFLGISGDRGFTGNLKLYRDQGYSTFSTTALSVAGADSLIIYDTQSMDIYDQQSLTIGSVVDSDVRLKKKFNYREVMVAFTDLYGDKGVEIKGITLLSAIIGD